MRCANCGFESPPGFAFCGKCGRPFGAVCSRCGAELPPGFAFCGKCGTPVAAAPAPAPDRLTSAELERLRAYLPAEMAEALTLEPAEPAPRLLESSQAHLTLLLEATCLHLPPYLAEPLLRAPRPARPGGQFLNGALLFADISGFTTISEQLSRFGREGAEEITGIVNRYFEVMLSILREHGGQLIKFGGDALLALFLEPGSAVQAAQAAFAMQAAMGGFAETPTSQGVFPLMMKVSVRRGRFFAADLGTAQAMEYALLGADVNTTAALASAAAAGQVLTDAETLRTLPAATGMSSVAGHAGYFSLEHLAGPSASPVASPCVTLPASAPTLEGLRQTLQQLEALTPYLPAGLLRRWGSASGGLGAEGEHRLVATLFANVHGLGDLADRFGPGREEQIVAELNRYFTSMEAAIRQFGGVVNKIDLSDHGDKLLAFFGAPVAHEDDAERVVRAALLMQTELARLAQEGRPGPAGALPALSQQIGLSYGPVFAGYVGASWRHEYTVMGDEVNLAARLMAVAEPGQVTATEDVQRKVQALFDLEPRGEVQLKGKSQPTPVFVVSGERAEPGPLRGLAGLRSPLVGRDAQWQQLLATLRQFEQGKGQIVSVVGEAGLGKSRLVLELRRYLEERAGQRAPQWFEGRCLSYTESVSYYPYQQLVRDLGGVTLKQPDDEAWLALSETLARHLPPDEALAHLPYLANFVGLNWESRRPVADYGPADLRAIPTSALQEKVRYLDGEALQRRTFLAVRALLVARARAGRLALVLDDLHWVDEASLTLTQYLMPVVAASGILLLLLYRPDREKGCWQLHEKAQREFDYCATSLALRPLTPDENRRLLSNLIALEQWPPEVVELLVSRTEGNPLYLEEVLRGLMDDQILVRDADGHWQYRGGEESLKVPTTLQGVMMARLDRLDEPSRNTAQVAAVVGRTFAYDLVRKVTRADPADLNSNLVRLQQHEIIYEAERAEALVYAFQHGMMQEVYYESLLARARRLYHCRIAAYLEATGAEESESDWPLIAHHAFMGQDWPRAVRWQMLAGRQARKLYANKEAQEYFAHALVSAAHLLPDETRLARQTCHQALGELATTAGRYAEAREHLQAARELGDSRQDHEAQARACHWLARTHELCGEYPAALEWIEQGLASLSGAKTASAAQLRLTAGLIYCRQGGRLDQAAEQGEVSLQIATELGDLAVLARGHLLLAVISLQRGDNPTSAQEAQRGLELYTRAGDLVGQGTAHNQIANAHINMGLWTAADQGYRRASEVFEKIGDLYNAAFVANNLGEIALNQGRLDEAIMFYQAALRGMERSGSSPYALGWMHNNLGAAFIRRGELEAARQHLQLGREFAERAQSRDILPELQRHWAEAALAAGDLPEAEARGQQGLSLARELEMENEAGIALRLLGEVALAQQLFESAEPYLQESLALLQRLGETYQAAQTQLALARLAYAQGQTAAATAHLAACEPVFARLEAAPDLAAVHKLSIELATPRNA